MFKSRLPKSKYLEIQKEPDNLDFIRQNLNKYNFYEYKLGKTTILIQQCSRESDDNLDIIKTLVESEQSKPKLQDGKGNTALIMACKENRREVVKLLLKTGKHAPETRNKNGENALYFASLNGNDEIAFNLMGDENSHPENRTKNGETALMAASREGFDYVVVDLLYTRKSHPEYQDKNGNTALMLACERDHFNIARQLMWDRESNAYQFDKNGRTALMKTVIVGCFDIVEELLEINYEYQDGSRPGFQDNDGYTALMLAIIYKREAIAKRILDYKCGRIHAKNKHGEIAADLAKKFKMPKIGTQIKKYTDEKVEHANVEQLIICLLNRWPNYNGNNLYLVSDKALAKSVKETNQLCSESVTVSKEKGVQIFNILDAKIKNRKKYDKTLQQLIDKNLKK